MAHPANSANQTTLSIPNNVREKLTASLFRELDEEYQKILSFKASELTRLKVVRTRHIESSRSKLTKDRPSKRFKALQEEGKSRAQTDGGFTINPFERRRQHMSDPFKLYQRGADGDESPVEVLGAAKKEAARGEEKALRGLVEPREEVGVSGKDVKEEVEEGEVVEHGMIDPAGPRVVKSSQSTAHNSGTATNRRPTTVRGIRDGLAEKIAVAIRQGSKGQSNISSKLLDRLGHDLETRLFEMYGSDVRDDEYSRHVRKFVYNFSRNEKICKEIIGGVILPEKLVQMSSKDLATEEINRERMKQLKKRQKSSILKDSRAWVASYSTLCPKCGEMNCQMFSLEAIGGVKADTWRGSSGHSRKTHYKCLERDCRFHWKED